MSNPNAARKGKLPQKRANDRPTGLERAARVANLRGKGVPQEVVDSIVTADATNAEIALNYAAWLKTRPKAQ